MERRKELEAREADREDEADLNALEDRLKRRPQSFSPAPPISPHPPFPRLRSGRRLFQRPSPKTKFLAVTFVDPVAARRAAWSARFDINQPQDPITSGDIWPPVEFEGDRPIIHWRNPCDLSVFSQT